MSRSRMKLNVVELSQTDDFKGDVRARLGNTKISVLGTNVLIATYIRPEKTAGGIILPDRSKDEDVYQGKVIALLAHVPSFLKVVAFRIPKDTDLFLSVFGYVLQPCWLFPPQDKPHFILDLNPNAEGNVVCPNCHHAGLLASWAPDTDHVGCPNCGWKVTNLVEKL